MSRFLRRQLFAAITPLAAYLLVSGAIGAWLGVAFQLLAHLGNEAGTSRLIHQAIHSGLQKHVDNDEPEEDELKELLAADAPAAHSVLGS